MGSMHLRRQAAAEQSTYAELAVVLYRLLVILLDIIREVVDWDIVVLNVLHDLALLKGEFEANIQEMAGPTRFLKPRSSDGVKESALPITGMTFTRGERRRMSSMSISRSLPRFTTQSVSSLKFACGGGR